MLDGKREDAARVWGRIVKASSATDFFVRAINARLEGKTLEHPLLPDPGSFNLFLALAEN